MPCVTSYGESSRFFASSRAENAPDTGSRIEKSSTLRDCLDDVGQRTVARRVDALADAIEQQRRARAVAAARDTSGRR